MYHLFNTFRRETIDTSISMIHENLLIMHDGPLEVIVHFSGSYLALVDLKTETFTM